MYDFIESVSDCWRSKIWTRLPPSAANQIRLRRPWEMGRRTHAPRAVD